MIKIQYTGAADYGQYVTALVAGPPGRGKTRFVVTAEDPFLINAEAGTMSIADQNIPTTPIECINDLFQIRNLLSLGPDKVQEIIGIKVGTVILDSFDEIQRLLVRERLEREQRDYMQIGDWTWLNDQLNSIVRGFRSLEMHVIFTCHLKDQSDGADGSIFHKLDLSGGIAHQLPGSVDLAMLLDTRSVTEVVDDETIKTNKTLLFTEPTEKYPWIKDRSGKLDAVIELNFEDDFQQIIKTIYDVKLAEGEHREVEFEMPGEEEPEEEEEISVEDKMKEADEVVAAAEKIAAAEKVVAAAEKVVAAAEKTRKAKRAKKSTDNKEEKAPKKERPELAGPGDRVGEGAGVDLSKYDHGDMVVLEGQDIPVGFQLGPDGKGLQVKGARFIYTISGEKVLSRNQLEDGIEPKLNAEVNSGLFCQASGVEVLPEDANISRIRLGQVLSDAEFEKRAR